VPGYVDVLGADVRTPAERAQSNAAITQSMDLGDRVRSNIWLLKPLARISTRREPSRVSFPLGRQHRDRNPTAHGDELIKRVGQGNQFTYFAALHESESGTHSPVVYGAFGGES
jgi:hypothetical protein